mmetsp:Transcript_30108/g.65701  ORF Transcript_30108/g.65701 Transcript_30108/m.65701 type:complete len:214 (+) Transcript_30108:216-857(+)
MGFGTGPNRSSESDRAHVHPRLCAWLVLLWLSERNVYAVWSAVGGDGIDVGTLGPYKQAGKMVRDQEPHLDHWVTLRCHRCTRECRTRRRVRRRRMQSRRPAYGLLGRVPSRGRCRPAALPTAIRGANSAISGSADSHGWSPSRWHRGWPSTRHNRLRRRRCPLGRSDLRRGPQTLQNLKDFGHGRNHRLHVSGGGQSSLGPEVAHILLLGER